jgi:hypothetical protein
MLQTTTLIYDLERGREQLSGRMAANDSDYCSHTPLEPPCPWGDASRQRVGRRVRAIMAECLDFR